MKKAVMMLVAALSAFALFAGNTCTWTGQAGDGNWATSGNWENDIRPESGNGDRVILSNTGNSAVISNGLGTISIDGLTIAAGSQAFKLVGDAIQLESKSGSSSPFDVAAIYDVTTDGEVEIATPLVLPTGTHYFRLVSGAALHLSGVISGAGGFDYQSTATSWKSTSWRETDRLKISGDNTFEGTVWLRNYCADLASRTALGKAEKTVYLVNHYAQYRFSAGGHYAYNFSVSDGADYLYFVADTTIDKLTCYQSNSNVELDGEGPYSVSFLNGFYVTGAIDDAKHKLDISFPSGGAVHVYEKFAHGSVSLGDRDNVRGDEKYVGGRLHLHCADVSYTSLRMPQGSVELYSPGVLNETDVPTYYYRRTDGITCYYLNGNGQTIDHLDTTTSFDQTKYIADTGRFFQSDTPAMLTLKATADGSANVSFKDALSVIYDAQGPYRQEITNRTITMTGDLVVSNGTFALVGTTTMKNAGQVRVTSGGVFEIASSTAKSLENVKKIIIEDGGLLKLATAADPFAGRTEVLLETGAQMDPGAGRTLTSVLLKYDGVIVANNRYQKIGGTDPTAEEVAWMAGDAVLAVDGKIAYWKQAIDGTWGDETKWAPATPASDIAVNLTAEGSSYTVTVDEDPGVAYKNLNVSHEPGGTATLEIAAPFETDSPDVVFGAGAVVSLVENGFWTWTPVPTGGGTAYDIATHLTMKDGATFTVDGGTFFANEYRGVFALGGADNATTSTLSVVSGLFDFLGANTTSAHLSVNPGGRLEVSGDGVAKFRGANQSIGLYGNGGIIDVSGSGRLELCGGDGRWFGGDTTFRENAVLVTTGRASDGGRPRAYLTPPAAGETMEILFKDHARIGATEGALVSDYFYRLSLANGIAGTTTKLTLAGDGVYNLGNFVEVGLAAGRGELRQSSGTANLASSRGLAVGTCDADATTATPIDCSGLLEVSGGTMLITAGAWNEYNRFNGFTVGNGYYVKAGREGRFEGRAVISGGTVTNDGYRSVIGVGIGQAKGELVQTGGTHIKAGDSGDIIVGFSGGEGLFAISNGLFQTLKSIDIWVGGCPTNELQRYLPYCPDRRDAKGVLDVAGGRFVSSNGRLFVGVDGSGELAIGETGLLTVKELAFSNAVDRALGTETRMRCTFGPTGVGKATVSSSLRIDPGAKLIVDASAYTGAAKGFYVLETANRTGDFAEKDVTVIPPPDNRLRTSVKWRGNKLRVGLSEGMSLIIR